MENGEKKKDIAAETEDGELSQEWKNKKKHIFILSSSGRPIYSRFGDELKICTIMGVIQAIVSFVAVGGDSIKSIIAGDHRIVFLLKGPLYFVLVTSNKEPITELQRQLEYLYNQIISTLTLAVNKIYASNSNYDLRGLLSGTEKFIDSLIKTSAIQLSYFINAKSILKLPYSIRFNTTTILQSAPAKPSSVAYAIMLCQDQVVNFIRPKKHLLQNEDLNLITNFIRLSPSIKQYESWIPLCLPKFNSSGYLHCYITYLIPEIDLSLLLLSTNSDYQNFHALSAFKNQVEKQLWAAEIMEFLKDWMNNSKWKYTVKDCNVEGVWHFVYKNLNFNQYSCPEVGPPYNCDEVEQKRLFKIYQKMKHRVVREEFIENKEGPVEPSAEVSRAHKVYYQRSDRETIVAWITNVFELFVVFGPDESKSVCIRACNKLRDWLKKEEDSIFIAKESVW
eukprot:TRINITY_DN4933_c0_g1_i1.p1 TRINITY_DN4933_c0_g1~~TRINITY_DN4933_c0_g1_i1.p1  ORF type:complete len:450 (+),score=93.10 TRINITY_DN4933_c0_g1_i1:48-1397(+)